MVALGTKAKAITLPFGCQQLRGLLQFLFFLFMITQWFFGEPVFKDAAIVVEIFGGFAKREQGLRTEYNVIADDVIMVKVVESGV